MKAEMEKREDDEGEKVVERSFQNKSKTGVGDWQVSGRTEAGC